MDPSADPDPLRDPQGIEVTERKSLRERRLQSYNRIPVRGRVKESLTFLLVGVPEADLDSLESEITSFINKSLKLYSLRSFLPKSIVGRAALEHYQLRHNVGYARNHNIIYNSILDSGLGLINGERWENERCGIRSFNILTNESHVLLDLHKEQKSHIKLCSLSTLDDLISAGGVRGELLIKRMYSMEDKTHYLSLTDKENGITNFLKLYEASSGSLNVVSCNNDGFLRIINIDTKKIISGFSFDWAPNCVSPNPEKKLALVVGDNVESQIISLDTGKVLYSIAGHVDHNFACDWAPDGLLFATGSQDLTCRIYDSRFINSALYVFPASMTAFRSLHFSPASNLLLMAESADFLHLIDLGQPLLSQEIDFFGEVTGTCWNFKGNCFYAGNADLNIGGIFEYQLNADQDFIL